MTLPPSSRSPALPSVLASGGSDVAPQSSKQMFGGGTGAGVSVTPVAFLVVSGGNVRTVQLVEKVTAVDNAIAALPELVEKITAMIKKTSPLKRATHKHKK